MKQSSGARDDQMDAKVTKYSADGIFGRDTPKTAIRGRRKIETCALGKALP